jgi:hypothetical protein
MSPELLPKTIVLKVRSEPRFLILGIIVQNGKDVGIIKEAEKE